MIAVWDRVEPLLARVQKPARYIGCEDGARTPQHGVDRHGAGKVAWLLAYPDTYEIGLPNQGLQILYEILNERDDAVAERTYAPWRDLEALMREHDVPLFSVDTHLAAGGFDLLAFNLSAELVYTNVLNMVDLAGIPIRSVDRLDGHPLVVIGGHCAFNPEPLADYVDLVVLGDGEEVVGEITEVIGASRRAGHHRGELLMSLAAVPGVYVPSLYEPAYGDDGRLVSTEARDPRVPVEVDKRTVADLGAWPYPTHPLAPLTEVVHDRLSVEVFRGCTRGCRFCQAGMITRPVRERPAEQVRTMIANGLRQTGYDEVSLSSLSTADFSNIDEVIDAVNQPGCPQVTVALPSLRVDAFTVGLAARVNGSADGDRPAGVRRSGLTFAPEAGTWRLRSVINKLITEDDLYGAVDAAYANGWTRMKLYFLIGLPTETDEDVLAIGGLARNVVAIGRRHTNRASVTISIGGFVPKAHTPFQWFGQNTHAELRRKVQLLRDALGRVRGVQLKWHDPAATTAEGIVSRGDRRIGAVIERVWRDGGSFQEWSECFELRRWTDALAAEGLSLEDTVYRHRSDHETLPWDHVRAGLHKDFLWLDWQEAQAAGGLEDCRWTPCYDCGVCTGFGIEHVVASTTAPAGGSQGTAQDLSRGGEVPILLGRKPAVVGAEVDR